MSLRRQDHLMILSPGPLRAPVRLLSSNTGQSPLLGLSSSPPPLSSSGSFSLFFSLSFNFLLAVRHFLLARSHGTHLTLYTQSASYHAKLSAFAATARQSNPA